jgi:hypothetical protein
MEFRGFLFRETGGILTELPSVPTCSEFRGIIFLSENGNPSVRQDKYLRWACATCYLCTLRNSNSANLKEHFCSFTSIRNAAPQLHISNQLLSCGLRKVAEELADFQITTFHLRDSQPDLDPVDVDMDTDLYITIFDKMMKAHNPVELAVALSVKKLGRYKTASALIGIVQRKLTWVETRFK